MDVTGRELKETDLFKRDLSPTYLKDLPRFIFAGMFIKRGAELNLLLNN